MISGLFCLLILLLSRYVCACWFCRVCETPWPRCNGVGCGSPSPPPSQGNTRRMFALTASVPRRDQGVFSIELLPVLPTPLFRFLTCFNFVVPGARSNLDPCLTITLYSWNGMGNYSADWPTKLNVKSRWRGVINPTR